METDETVVTVFAGGDPEDSNLMFPNSFITEDYDATEERLSKSNSIHACRVCEDVFRTKSDLKDHMKSSYECRTKKNYRCIQCQEIFPNVGSFQLHLLSHSQENAETPNKRDEDEFSNYVCELCGKDFVTQQLKRVHIELHFEQRGSVLCPTCGKCICSKEMYHRHRRMHGFKPTKEEKRKNELQCQICDQKFKGARSLRDHLRIHTGEPIFECSVCSRTFPKKSSLRVHLKSHFKSPTEKHNKTKVKTGKKEDNKNKIKK